MYCSLLCSVLNKPYDIPEMPLVAGQTAKLIKTGLWRELGNDGVEYEKPLPSSLKGR